MCNNNRDGRVPSVFLAAATGVPSKGKGVTHTRIPILMGGGRGSGVRLGLLAGGTRGFRYMGGSN